MTWGCRGTPSGMGCLSQFRVDSGDSGVYGRGVARLQGKGGEGGYLRNGSVSVDKTGKYGPRGR